MKVAIYVLADAFIPLMYNMGENFRSRCGFEVEYLSFVPRDHRWLKKLTKHIHPSNPNKIGMAGYISPLSDQEALSFSAFMQVKHGGSDSEWIDRIHAIAAELDRFTKTFKPDLFILWNNEDHIGQVICHLSKVMGIKTIIMENGYFPKTLQIDPIGVNANSTATTIAFADIKSKVDSGKPSQSQSFHAEIYECGNLSPIDYAISFLKRTFTPGYYRRFPEHRGSSWLQKKRIELARKKIRTESPPIPKEYIFIPLQVHDDTQVVLNGLHFKSVESFLDQARKDIYNALGNDINIVVKEHPEDLCRYDFSAIRSNFPELIWFQKGNTDELIKKSRAVVVLNSSVGLQAIQNKKPTVVYGKCFYAREEVCFPVRDLRVAPSLIKDAFQAGISSRSTNIDVFVNYLTNHFFVNGTWRSVDSACVSNACQKVLELVNSSNQDRPH